MGRKLLAFGLGLAVLAAAACGRDGGDTGSVWQWVDAKGSLQFAESLDDVPEAYRSKAGKIPVSAKVLSRKRAAPAKDEARVATASTQPAAPVGPVRLYVSSLFDNHQAATIQALQEAGIAFETIDVEKDDSAKEHLKVLSHIQFPNAGDGYAAPMLEHEDAFFFGQGKEPVALLALHLDWVRRGRPDETPAVYVTTSCGYSKALMEELDAIGQPYQAYDVENDSDAAGRLVDVTGSAGVPVTMVNGRVIQGYGPDTAKQIAAASHQPKRSGLRGFFSKLLGS